MDLGQLIRRQVEDGVVAVVVSAPALGSGVLRILDVEQRLGRRETVGGNDLAFGVVVAAVTLVELRRSLLDAQQGTVLLCGALGAGVHTVASQIIVAVGGEEALVLEQFAVSRAGHELGARLLDHLLRLHVCGVDEGQLEATLIVAVGEGIEDLAVAIVGDAGGVELVFVWRCRQVELALAEDGHVLGVDLDPKDLVRLAIRADQYQGVVVDPSVRVAAVLQRVLFEADLLDDGYLVRPSGINNLILAEAILLLRNLVVILAADDGLLIELLRHVYARAFEVELRLCIERLGTLD